AAGITRYRAWLQADRQLSFADYEALWHWSTTEIETFWESIWEYCGVIAHSPYETVLTERRMPGTKWFEGARLNYAEHSLAFGRGPESTAQPAIIFQSELVDRAEVSWEELSGQVGSLGRYLRALGLEKGDRAVAYMPNIPET